MGLTTNQMLSARKEDGCIGISAERKYYEVGTSFVKRSLRPREWQITLRGTIHVPRCGRERLLNEAAAISFLRENTNIPLPTLHCSFEDDDAVYLVTEKVHGVAMADLETDQQRAVVQDELEIHLQTLRALRSEKLGGPSGIVLLPYRATLRTVRDCWNSVKRSDGDGDGGKGEVFVFCHNDLSQQNVIVDPKSLKVKAILDWEYAGFYPEWFERRFFERLGPSVALDGEEDDAQRIVDFMAGREG